MGRKNKNAKKKIALDERLFEKTREVQRKESEEPPISTGLSVIATNANIRRIWYLSMVKQFFKVER